MNEGGQSRQLIFDCDPGCDDALAIALVAASKVYKSVDLLTVAGNVSVEQTTANACRIVSLLKLDGLSDGIKVYPGCARGLMGDIPSAASVHGRDGLGDAPNNLLGGEPGEAIVPCKQESKSAVGRLLELSVPTKGNSFDLLCTGPLTNLATALNLMTEGQRFRFWEGCQRLVVMGGCFGSQGNITPSAEFNTFFDPVAAQIVLDFLREARRKPEATKTANSSSVPEIHFVPLDATETVAIPLTSQKTSPEEPTNTARFLFYALQQYGEFHAFHCKRPDDAESFGIQEFDEYEYVKSQLGGSLGVKKLHKFCYLHDPLAAWVLLNDLRVNGATWETATIRIDTGRGESRGRIILCAHKLARKGPLKTPEIGTEVKWLVLEKPEIRLEFVKKIAELLFLPLP